MMSFTDATRKEVVEFIQAHLETDTATLMLSAGKFPDLPMKYISSQIASRQKGKQKLPQWFSNSEIIFPPKENLEQASSEITAKFKSRFLEGKSFVDLTGGSGIDTFYLSKKFDSASYVEPDAYLCDISKYNFEKLGAQVEVISSTAEEFLSANKRKYDWAFIDPSRRDGAKKRFYALEDCVPNVIELSAELLKAGHKVLLKASPMLDIKRTLRYLKECFKVQVLAVDNEVKELLFYLEESFDGETIIEAWNISDKKEDSFFSFNYSEEKVSYSELSEPLKYLYEPNSALMKAGPYQLIALRNGLKKLHSSTHLYTSDVVVADFPGRIFNIEEVFKPSKKEIKKRFPAGKVNVVVRNYPEGATDLKKRFKLKDGGETFLVFCTTKDGSLKAIKCSRAL